MHDSKFIKNFANNVAGAIYVYNFVNCEIFNTTFSFNSANNSAAKSIAIG